MIESIKSQAPDWATYATIDSSGFTKYWNKKPFHGNSNGFTLWCCSAPYKSKSGPYLHGAEEQIIQL